jgi:hypothetical protein
VELLNVSADLVNQAGNFFFSAELRDLVRVHSILNHFGLLVLSYILS